MTTPHFSEDVFTKRSIACARLMHAITIELRIILLDAHGYGAGSAAFTLNELLHRIAGRILTAFEKKDMTFFPDFREIQRWVSPPIEFEMNRILSGVGHILQMAAQQTGNVE